MCRKIITTLRVLAFLATLVFSLVIVGLLSETFKRNNQLALDAAACNNSIWNMKLAFLLGADANGKVLHILQSHNPGDPPSYRRPLEAAVIDDQKEAVVLLLMNGADVNAINENRTVLDDAEEFSNIEIVQILRNAGAKRASELRDQN